MPRLYPVRRRLQPLVARGIPALFAVFALSLGSATAQQATVPPANPPDTTAAADTTSKPLTAQQLQSMVARKGRASYLGERSAGHQDPGATSTTLLLESAARSLA